LAVTQLLLAYLPKISGPTQAGLVPWAAPPDLIGITTAGGKPAQRTLSIKEGHDSVGRVRCTPCVWLAVPRTSAR
jgi:hypothetical protein